MFVEGRKEAMAETLQIVELASAGSASVFFLVVGLVTAGKALYRSRYSKSAISNDEFKMTPLIWPRLAFVLCSMIWTVRKHVGKQ